MRNSATSTVCAVLNLLSDGQFYSGQFLAESLSLSRTAIWQAVQTIIAWGVDIHAVQGKGYRLAEPLELLDYVQIVKALNGDIHKRIEKIYIFPVVDSTNLFLKNKSRLSPLFGHVCVAEMQTQGRGRRGRHWVSPFGVNLYFSLGWRFKNGLGAGCGRSGRPGHCRVRREQALHLQCVDYRSAFGVVVEHDEGGFGKACDIFDARPPLGEFLV